MVKQQQSKPFKKEQKMLAQGIVGDPSTSFCPKKKQSMYHPQQHMEGNNKKKMKKKKREGGFFS
ncbi:hypothetical protein QQP08_014854 [Theobroma cacao]|nr:hypothetical protein QQP08_014854 [Theobroma cacao]